MEMPHYTRDENEAERLDRHWLELLQELRVAQTGVQILFAFLLVIAFSPPFQEAGDYTHTVFAITLVFAAMATGLLIAPVAVHRLVYRRQLRVELVQAADKMAIGGLFLMLLAVAGGVLLALDVALSRTMSIILAAAIVGWFAVFWYAVPLVVRRRGKAMRTSSSGDSPD
jgi:Family of unknown function (DUF6328)